MLAARSGTRTSATPAPRAGARPWYYDDGYPKYGIGIILPEAQCEHQTINSYGRLRCGSNQRFPALQASALPLCYVIGYGEIRIGLTAIEPPQHIAQRGMPQKTKGSQVWRPGRHYGVGTPLRIWVGLAHAAVATAAPRRAVATPTVQAFRVLAPLPWAMGCSILGCRAEPLVRTQFPEHPPSLHLGAYHLKKWIQHRQKTPIPFLSPHNPHRRGGFFGGGSRS